MRVVVLMPVIVQVSDNVTTLESEVTNATAKVRAALNQAGYPTLARAPQVFSENDAEHAQLAAAIAHSDTVTILS